jgi:multiple sugar transport system substrate-binding protein
MKLPRARTLVGAVALLALIVSVSGCGGGDSSGAQDTAASVKPGELRKFEGQTINVATLAAGPKGVISGVVYKYRHEWEAKTGGKVEVSEIPFGDIQTKIMADFNTGVGTYDSLIAPAYGLGEYVAGEYVTPAEQFAEQNGYPKDDVSAVLPAVKHLLQWGGTRYAVPFDGDEFLLWYRKDVLANPTFKREFRAKYGYELPDPPKTIDELIDAAKFFEGKQLPGSSKPGYGIAMSLKSGEGAAQYWYQAVAAPYSILPGGTVDQFHNVFWFDPETMEPLINDPGHVRGLEKLKQLALEGGPQEQLSWDLGQSWEAFLSGRAVFTINTADVASGAKESPAVKGKLGGSPVPGSLEVYNRETGNWEKRSKPNVVGNLLGANWQGTVSSLSEHQEAAYSFLAFLAEKEHMLNYAYEGADGVDPTSSFQFLKPEGEATVSGYEKAGWSGADAEAYSKAILDNLTHVDTYLPYLRNRGTSDIISGLDSAVTNTLAGRSEPQEALDGVAQEWEQLVEELGNEEYKDEYRTAIGYGKKPTGP